MVKLNKKVFIFIALVLGVVMFTSGFNFFESGFNFFNANKNEYGRFIRVGDMYIARSEHKAVLLQDGKVLIIGGATFAEAEIYDPNTKRFKLIGSQSKQNGSTATLLNNGKVLITGLAEHADLFDPKTETFIPTGKMNYPRYKHTATLLQDGKVLIVGGESFYDPERIFYEYSEIYHPETGKFEIGPKLNVKRFIHSAILLDNGNVLITGGGNDKEWLYKAELYDAKTNQFVPIGNANNQRITPDLIKLKDGKVLVFSGATDFELYDPVKRSFEVFMPDTVVKSAFKPVLLKNGNILLTAGTKRVHWWAEYSNSSWILDPYKKELMQGPNLINKRAKHTAILLQDGTVLLIGGQNIQSVKNLKSAEIFIPNTGVEL